MDFTQLSDVLLKATKRSVKDFFQTMCPLPLEEGLTYKEFSPDLNRENYEMVGLIALSGQLSGSISVFLKSKLAQDIASHLVKKELHSSELADITGELANIIAGSIKTWVHVNEGLDFDISCPSVVQGNQYLSVPHSAQTQFLGHRFKIQGQDMLVALSVNLS